MSENQNDSRNQQSGNKSNQNSSQDGMKKETNPNNPIASHDSKQGSHPGNQNHQESGSSRAKTDAELEEMEENEEETSEITGSRNTGDSDSEDGDDQNSRKGNM